ncbi:unnamed protein product, partial [Nesidiocoris tenuis]
NHFMNKPLCPSGQHLQKMAVSSSILNLILNFLNWNVFSVKSITLLQRYLFE